MDDDARRALRDSMRQRYAVHYSELNASHQPTENDGNPETIADTGEPMDW
nr:hypothetical protein [Pararhizobium sp. IMCC3301]